MRRTVPKTAILQIIFAFYEAMKARKKAGILKAKKLRELFYILNTGVLIVRKAGFRLSNKVFKALKSAACAVFF